MRIVGEIGSVGLLVGAFIGTGCWVDSNHCANNGGDAVCGEGYFCNSCQTPSQPSQLGGDIGGCVAQKPTPECHAQGGNLGDTGAEEGADSMSQDPGLTTTTTMGSAGQDGGETGDPDEPGNSDEPGSAETGSEGMALLEISEEDGSEDRKYDFGNVSLGGYVERSFIVSNTGGADAADVSIDVSGDAFASDANLGENDGCGEELAAGASCTVAVSFSPQELGLHDGVLTVSYGDGNGDAEASLTLVGGGEGASENLLQNPGGEAEVGENGEPAPSSWENLAQGLGDDYNQKWASVSEIEHVGNIFVYPHVYGGERFIAAREGDNGAPAHMLSQAVDVDRWKYTIDKGQMRFSLGGYARSLFLPIPEGEVGEYYNDRYKFKMIYRDSSGLYIGEWNSMWGAGNAWLSFTSDDVVPSGTHKIEVVLMCEKNLGDYCDAYFDDLNLHAEFP